MLLRECEEYLQDSRRLRDVASSKATRQIKTGWTNVLVGCKQILKVSKKLKHKRFVQTEGIEEEEIQRR